MSYCDVGTDLLLAVEKASRQPWFTAISIGVQLLLRGLHVVYVTNIYNVSVCSKEGLLSLLGLAPALVAWRAARHLLAAPAQTAPTQTARYTVTMSAPLEGPLTIGTHLPLLAMTYIGAMELIEAVPQLALQIVLLLHTSSADITPLQGLSIIGSICVVAIELANLERVLTTHFRHRGEAHTEYICLPPVSARCRRRLMLLCMVVGGAGHATFTLGSLVLAAHYHATFALVYLPAGAACFIASRALRREWGGPLQWRQCAPGRPGLLFLDNAVVLPFTWLHCFLNPIPPTACRHPLRLGPRTYVLTVGYAYVTSAVSLALPVDTAPDASGGDTRELVRLMSAVGGCTSVLAFLPLLLLAGPAFRRHLLCSRDSVVAWGQRVWLLGLHDPSDVERGRALMLQQEHLAVEACNGRQLALDWLRDRAPRWERSRPACALAKIEPIAPFLPRRAIRPSAAPFFDLAHRPRSRVLAGLTPAWINRLQPLYAGALDDALLAWRHRAAARSVRVNV